MTARHHIIKSLEEKFTFMESIFRSDLAKMKLGGGKTNKRWQKTDAKNEPDIRLQLVLL